MDELFKGRHFDREIIVLCVRWYLRYKLSFRDLVGDDGRTWTLPGAHDDHALDSTLCARIRETLEPLRSASWTVLARRRDLRQNQRTLDLSLPCRRLPVARQAGRRRGQSLLPACFQASGPTTA